MTAVEQFWKDVQDILPSSVDTETGIKLVRAYDQAKEMEKEQIVDAWDSCGESFITEEFDNADQYYNETFKSK
jgi:hypothetical protein